MKKTIKIHIAGVLFHVDEDAFKVLESYLNRIKSHFSTDREGNEIVTDIETRIAELLQLKINETKQVINLDDVNEMIEIMGRPEDFAEDTTGAHEEGSQPTSNSRRFYRDLDSNVVGGVCSGLGAYFNIDPIILRVLFIVLSFPLAGFPILLYLILWIIMPAAITTQQKMEMRGGNFTISDIERSVKKEYENVKHNLKNINKSKSARNVGNGLVEIINFFGRVLLVIIGVALILAGISLITSFFGLMVFSDSMFFWNHADTHHLFVPDFLLTLIHPKSVMLATICLIILVAAPVFAIIYWGLKLILRFKANDKIISLVGAFAWILSLIILIGITVFEARDYAFSTKTEDKIEIPVPKNKTIYLSTYQKENPYDEVYFFDDGIEIYTHREHPDRFYFETELRIKHTSKSSPFLLLEKEARGANTMLARENASNIQFEWYFKDSVLLIDRMFYQGNRKKWTFPELEATIYLPEGYSIYVDENLDENLIYAPRVDGKWSESLIGQRWVMTDDGLDTRN